jgi:hypothetical protein
VERCTTLSTLVYKVLLVVKEMCSSFLSTLASRVGCVFKALGECMLLPLFTECQEEVSLLRNAFLPADCWA